MKRRVFKKKYELSKGEVVEKWAKTHEVVMVWLSKVQAKAESAWHLWLFCGVVGKSPEELLAMKDDPKSRDAEYMLDKFLVDESSNLPNSVLVIAATMVKSFYKHHYRDLARASGQIMFVKQKPYRRHSKAELLKIYRSCMNPRDRALVTFVWSSGIAKESLSKIQWSDLEPDWERQETPHISLDAEKIKGHGRGKYRGVRQETFLTPEAKRDLAEYKEHLERVKRLEIKPEDHIWITVESPFSPLKYHAFTSLHVALSKRSGVPFSWHDARRYVETALEETKINPNWARKIRGRKVRGEEAPYSRPAVEELRRAYREAIPLLQFTSETELMELKKRQEAVEQLIEGMTPEQKELMRRHGLRLGKRREGAKAEGCEDEAHRETFEQIGEGKLLGYLKEGWGVIHELSNGDLIVGRP
jgi:hypothetical protein